MIETCRGKKLYHDLPYQWKMYSSFVGISDVITEMISKKLALALEVKDELLMNSSKVPSCYS